MSDQANGKYELPAMPIDALIAAPLTGIMGAQIATARQYAEFLQQVCVDADGRAKTIDFAVDQPLVDSEGRPSKEIHTHLVRMPLLAAVPHPNLQVTRCRVTFDMEITTSEHESTSKQEQGDRRGPDAGGESDTGSKQGAPIRPATFYGRVSHQREQSRASDSRAKLHMEIEAERGEPPESMMRVLDFLTETLTRPIRQDDHAPEPSTEDPGPAVDLVASQSQDDDAADRQPPDEDGDSFVIDPADDGPGDREP